MNECSESSKLLIIYQKVSFKSSSLALFAFFIHFGFVALAVADINDSTSVYANNCSLDESRNFFNYTSWNVIGNYLVEKGVYERAICRYNMSIMLAPYFVAPWNNRGIAFSHLGIFEIAMGSFDNALDLDPENGIIWRNKGALLSIMGNYDEALDCINKSIDLVSMDPASWNNKGVVLYEIGMYDDALLFLDKSISLNPYYASAWNNKGVIFAEKGNLNESLYYFKNAALLDQNLTEAWVNGGLVLSALGEKNKSEKSYAIAGELGYDNINSKEFLTRIEFTLMGEPKNELSLPQRFKSIIGSILRMFLKE